MTISSSTGRIQYTGNAATTDFATNFKLLDEDHVQVFLDGTLKTISTDYTVSGVGDSTATVTFNSAPGSGEVVTLRLSVPLTQETDLVNGQEFNADTVEQALDLGVQIDQALNEEIERTLRAPIDAPTSFDGELPSITAEYILRVNSAGTGFEVQPPSVAAGVGTLGSQNADAVAITGGTVSGLTSLSVSGDITVSGNVDGVDVAALKTDVDGFPDTLKNLSSDEIAELENIGSTSISGAQWGYLGAMGAQPLESISDDISPNLGGDLDVNGNSIVSTSNGDITLAPNGTGNVIIGNITFDTDQTVGAGQDNYVLTYDDGTGLISLEQTVSGDIVDDTTPQLGGDLDVNGNSIISASNGNITVTPNGTGKIILDGLSWPTVDGSNGQYLQTDGSGNLTFAAGAGGGGLANIVEDTTPQLGGNLDVNTNSIVSTSNGDITLAPNGTGHVLLGNYELDVDETVGAGQDNYVLTYDDGTGLISLEEAPGAASGITDVVDDITPQLGGDLDVNGNSIVSTSNADINITPNGTGNVTLGNITIDGDQIIGAGQDNYVLTYDDTAGTVQLEATASGNLVDDTTPQLGGQLDVNGNAIGDGTNELLTFTEDASAVNHVNIENEATGSGPIISAAGDDTNVDLNLAAKGTGDITLGNFTFDADQTVGAGQDNYVLTYDNAGGKISLEEAGGGGGGGIWTEISSTTASAASSVDFTGLSSTYKVYKVVFTGVSTALEMLFSTDNGSSFISTGYSRAAVEVRADVASVTVRADNETATDVRMNQTAPDADSPAFGEVNISGHDVSGEKTQFNYNVTHDGGRLYNTRGAGSNTSTAVVDAIRFQPSSGTFDGTFTLYGLN